MDNKLRLAKINFEYACHKKLEAKEKLGWKGWDDLEHKKEFEGKIVIQSLPLIQNDCVNIANYCMFLWNLMEMEKEEEKVNE